MSLYKSIQEHFVCTRDYADDKRSQTLEKNVSISSSEALEKHLCKLMNILCKYHKFEEDSFWYTTAAKSSDSADNNEQEIVEKEEYEEQDEDKQEEKNEEEEKQIFNPELAFTNLLGHHIKGLSLFTKKELSHAVTLKRFLFKYAMDILQRYYWEYTSKSSAIEKYFVSHYGTIQNKDNLDLESAECWEKFGDVFMKCS